MTEEILQYWKDNAEVQFSTLFNVAPIMMQSINGDGDLLEVSRFWADALGYEPEEMVGRHMTDFMTEASCKYAEETVLPEFFRTGQIHSVDYDFLTKDGRVLHVLLSAVAQYDDAGNFVRSLAIMFDNSEAKRASAALIQSQRTDAIGRLVAGVAHDFNNLLMIIQGNLDFVLSDIDSPERATFLTNAYRASERGASLTKQLLTYGRKAQIKPELTDINRAIREIDSMLRRVIPATISIETVAAAGLWKTEVDRHKLDTAIINIVNNARDALPDLTGKLTIETANVHISEDYIFERFQEIAPGRYVMLAISDNGSGMTEETMQQAFEPFFSTKPPNEGSGLGLATVYGFMRQSNGEIRIYSELGAGTTIKLYFPAATATEAPRPSVVTKPEVGGMPGAEFDIFVVEDEVEVLRVLVRQLQKLGLRVSSAASGDEALEKLEAGYQPRILLTDIVMAGKIQGPELAERAREIVDGLGVIFVSGYPNQAAIHGNVVEERDIQLVKPLGERALANAVARMIKDLGQAESR